MVGLKGHHLSHSSCFKHLHALSSKTRAFFSGCTPETVKHQLHPVLSWLMMMKILINKSGSSLLLHDAICWYTSLYLYTPPACFLTRCDEVKHDDTFRYGSCKIFFCLQCYRSCFMHDWMYECGFLYGICWTVVYTDLVLYSCSYISIRCFMYNATINLDCNTTQLLPCCPAPRWVNTAPYWHKTKVQKRLQILYHAQMEINSPNTNTKTPATHNLWCSFIITTVREKNMTCLSV